LKRYEEIPSGKFAIIMIKKDIADAEKAIAFDDTVEMVRCCKALKRCE